jgi:tRNA/rRNA methyltransferase
LLLDYHFILVNPARGENVGFAARALKTLGFGSLRLVGENLQDSVPARKTGYGSHDLLDRVSNFSTLEQALAGMDFVIGATSRPRIKRYDPHTPSQINRILTGKHSILQHVALVFGSEENGLSTEELDRCDLTSTISLAAAYPSLNLAQSVLIYAWELNGVQPPNDPKTINTRLQGLLKKEITELLAWLEIDRKPLLEQRIMDRVLLLDAGDSELLMNVLVRLNRKVSD